MKLADIDLEALMRELFPGELTAAEWRMLREALTTRLDRLREQTQEEKVDPEWVRQELAILREQIAALREEELIAEFVEMALRATLAQEELRRGLEEEGGENRDGLYPPLKGNGE
ncbi:MAG TPA: hypothetical protein EYP85_15035 [Armatimonadetes bacterium]|nr:hypothetical protein [Armatimonadota bacterium]